MDDYALGGSVPKRIVRKRRAHQLWSISVEVEFSDGTPPLIRTRDIRAAGIKGVMDAVEGEEIMEDLPQDLLEAKQDAVTGIKFEVRRVG